MQKAILAIITSLVFSCGVKKETVIESRANNNDENVNTNTNANTNPDTTNNTPPPVDIQFLNHVLEFERLRPGQKKVTTSIELAEINDGTTLGVCVVWRNQNQQVVQTEIKLDRTMYFQILAADPIGIRTLIFHELAHCELLRDHIDLVSVFNNQVVPYSIMHPRIFNDFNVYRVLNDHYISELFTGRSTVLTPSQPNNRNFKSFNLEAQTTITNGDYIGTVYVN